jgi:Na+/melibiose symporter-like transporter
MLGIPVILLLLRFLLIREKPELLRWKGQPGRQPLGEVLGTAFRNPYVLLLVGCACLAGMGQTILNSLMTEAQTASGIDAALLSLSGIGQLLAVFSLIFFLPLAGKKGKDLLLVLGLGLSLLGHLGICLWDPMQHTTGFAVFIGLAALGRAPLLMLLAVFLLEAAGESAQRSGVHAIGTMAALWCLADFLGARLGTMVSTWLYDGQYHRAAFWLPAILSLAALALAVLALLAHQKQKRAELPR